MSVIFSIVASVLAILVYLIADWYDKRESRKYEERRNEIQKIRQEILDRNTDAVQSRIDRLSDGSSSNSTREQSAEDIQRRISTL